MTTRKRKAHFVHGNVRITVTDTGIVFRKKHARVTSTLRWNVIVGMAVTEHKNGQLSVFGNV